MAKLEVTESGQMGCIIVEGKGKFVPLVEWNKKAEQVMQIQRKNDILLTQIEVLRRELQACQNVLHMLALDGQVTSAYADDAKKVLAETQNALTTDV